MVLVHASMRYREAWSGRPFLEQPGFVTWAASAEGRSCVDWLTQGEGAKEWREAQLALWKQENPGKEPADLDLRSQARKDYQSVKSHFRGEA